MDKLKELKIDQDTVVIFSSDNGPHKEGGVDPKFFQSAGPLRGTKRDLYEGGVRVPLIVRWPCSDKAGPGKRFLFGAFWDFMPTLAEIASAKCPTNIDGISFVPTLLGKTQTNRNEFLYWEFHERGFQQAVRMGDWKAIRPQAGEPLELYNLKSDIGEKQDVADKNPAVIARVEEYLKTARTDSSAGRLNRHRKNKGLQYSQLSLTRNYFTCVGAVKSRLRRVRATSWLIQMIARTIPSRTAASKNHGQV